MSVPPEKTEDKHVHIFVEVAFELRCFCAVCVFAYPVSAALLIRLFDCLSAALRFQKALADRAGERKRKGENPGSVMQHFHAICQRWSISNDLQPLNQSTAVCLCRAPSVSRRRELKVQPSSERCAVVS